MKIQFYKYEGTGNDFILIDNRDKKLSLKNKKSYLHLCNRRFGIGADGVILLQKIPYYDFEMIYFNSDGKESSMCGNGGRCITHLANHLGLIKSKTEFKAIDGLHSAFIEKNGVIHLKMKDVKEIIDITQKTNSPTFFLNTGSPHWVKFVKNISKINILLEGKKIRYNPSFRKNGVNVNFAERQKNNLIMRTYERGVEGETLSCGTGAVATAICSILGSKFINKEKNLKINIKTLGGDLQVKFDYVTKENAFTNIWLSGKVKQVFKGEINI